MIVTSNKPFSAWGEIFGDDMAATAMVDRLIHHAEILSLKGDSYRLKDRDLGPRTRPPNRRNRPDRHPSATSPSAAERLTTRRSLPGTRSEALKATIAASGLALRARPSRRRSLCPHPPTGGSILNRRHGVNSQPALTPGLGGGLAVCAFGP